MNKQTYALIVVALGLAILYIVGFTDFLKHQNIQISSRISPATGLMAFYLDKAYPLTSIKVVAAEDAKTNKFPHPLWHMVVEKEPAPITAFGYGGAVKGMKPEIATALPEKLQSGMTYSVLLETGNARIKGEETFTMR